MQVTFSLPRALDFSALQRLQKPLLTTRAVLIETAPPRLRVDGEAAAVAGLERALGELFAQDMRAVPETDSDLGFGSLYTLADAVLTVILRADEGFPEEFATTLARWNVQPCALRCLALPTTGNLGVEVYLHGWASCVAQLPGIQALADRWGVDLVLAESDSKRPRRRLVAFDMDSTLIQCEVIDELAARAGVGAEVAAVTARAMRGELDFRSSFRERMAKLRGLSARELEVVARELPLMPGAKALLAALRAQGHHTVILSGGFDYFALRLQQQLGLHEVHANHLHIVNERLTGEVEGEIVDGQRKAFLLQQLASEQGIAMADTVAVGDGANDLPMLAAAGMGVAFHAKPLVRQEAPFAMMHSDLSALLAVLGVPYSEP